MNSPAYLRGESASVCVRLSFPLHMPIADPCRSFSPDASSLCLHTQTITHTYTVALAMIPLAMLMTYNSRFHRLFFPSLAHCSAGSRQPKRGCEWEENAEGRVSLKTKIVGFALKWSNGRVGDEGIIDFVWVPLLPRLANLLTQIRNRARRLLAADDFQAFVGSGWGPHLFYGLTRRDSVAIFIEPDIEMVSCHDMVVLWLRRRC
jgi:hypothetical protein